MVTYTSDTNSDLIFGISDLDYIGKRSSPTITVFTEDTYFDKSVKYFSGNRRPSLTEIREEMTNFLALYMKIEVGYVIMFDGKSSPL